MRILYDSKKSFHKTPFGCLRQEEPCTLQIQIPRACETTTVELVLEKENGAPYQRLLFTLDSHDDLYETYVLRFALQKCGLFFYYFDIHTHHSSFPLYKEGAHNTSMSYGGKWQITCYPKDYQTPAAFQGKVMYQIFPDRFHQAGICDLTGKLTPYTLHRDPHDIPVYYPDDKGIIQNNDFFGGNLKGIQEKLPYLEKLGVSILYLNPIFKSYSNHRYDTGDYLQIDPMLGTEEDFRQLCREAHRRGIRVLLDGVFNHTGSNSRYFNAEGFYPELGAAQSQDSLYFDWYSFHPWPTDYDAWWGVRTLPAVNEEAPTYRDFIVRSQDSVVRHWLRQGADGWRLDVADELPDDFIAEIRQAMEAEKPDSFLLGEVWEDGSNKIAYSHRRRYLLGRETHGLMNYPFRTAALAWLRGGDASDFRRDMEEIRENYPPAAFHSGLNILGTHDTPRLLTMLGAARTPESKDDRATYRLSPEELDMGLARLRLGALLLYSFPGSPTVFYGDEAGVQGFEDPLNRGTYPWGREDPALLAYFRQLGALRKQRVSLQCGDIGYLYAVGGGLVLQRQSEDEVTVAAMNAEMQPLELSIPWSGALAKDALTGQQFFARNGMLRLTLPPVGGVLLV